MGYRTYTIDLALTPTGASCSQPVISWENPPCGEIVCTLNGGKTIEVNIPDDCLFECFYVTVECLDPTCSTCGPQRLKICPCETSANCPDCHTCVNGLCVSDCDPDENCIAGVCRQCEDDADCTGNRICTPNGGCVCPPNLPYVNSRNECVACVNDNNCGPCGICVDNVCVPKCDGLCDSATGNCVKCINSGDCPSGEVCNNGTCSCPGGFIRNPDTGLCEPEPECERDSDCLDCEICRGERCVPQQCPDGFVCDGGDCLPECECGSGPCSATRACVSYDATTCYCKECETLPNGSCSPGCIPGPDGNCIPNPCGDSVCDNGSQCADGCGCDETTSRCVPCNSLNCPGECDGVLGCGCTGQGCTDVGGGCTGNCVSDYDCGPNCTCTPEGCRSCRDFNCEDCEGRINCNCDSGRCDGNGGGGPGGGGPGGGGPGGGGPGGGGPGGGGCPDSFQLIKDDTNCTLEARLTSTAQCACSKMSLAFVSTPLTQPNAGMQTLNVDVFLHKGSASSFASTRQLPLVSDASNPLIADNEEPSTMSVVLRATPNYEEFDLAGRFVQSSTGSPIQVSASLSNLGQVALSLQIHQVGSEISPGLKVVSYLLELLMPGSATFPNGCVYPGPIQVGRHILRVGATGADFKGYEELISNGYRAPLFTLYRSANGSYNTANIIRKAYIPGSGGVYSDKYLGPDAIPEGKYPLTGKEGSLWPGYYYKVTNDCACVRDADAGQLRFCNPNMLNYELSECNTKLKILQPFEPCAVNQDGLSIPSAAKTKWELVVDGVVKAVWQHSRTHGMVISGSTETIFKTYNFDDGISRIEIRQKGSSQCLQSYDVPGGQIQAPEVITNCSAPGAFFEARVAVIQGENEIVGVLPSNGSVVRQGDFWVMRLPKGVSTSITYTFEGNCVLTRALEESCCEAFEVVLDPPQPVVCGTTPVVVRALPQSGVAPFTFTWTAGGTQTSGNTRSFSGEAIGTVKVTDSLGCETTKEFVVGTSPGQNLTFDDDGNVCKPSSQGHRVYAQAFNSGPDGTYTATINGVTNQFPVVNGRVDFGFFNAATTIVVTSYSSPDPRVVGGNCVQTVNRTYNLTFSDTVAVTMTLVNQNQVCAGDTIRVRFDGPAGAVIRVVGFTSEGERTITLDADGEAESTRIAATGAHTFTITSVTVGECVTSPLLPALTVNVLAKNNIVLVTNQCSATSQVRLLTFSIPVEVRDQNNAVIPPTNGLNRNFEVNPSLVSAITATSTGPGCADVKTFDIDPCGCPPLNVAITQSPTATCPGTIVTLTAAVTGGTAPYDFAWSGGGTGSTRDVTVTSSTQSLTVQVTDANGCTGQGNFVVPAAAGPAPALPVGEAGWRGFICQGESVLFSAPQSAQWLLNGTVVHTGSTYRMFAPPAGQTHTLQWRITVGPCVINGLVLSVNGVTLNVTVEPAGCNGNIALYEITTSGTGMPGGATIQFLLEGTGPSQSGIQTLGVPSTTTVSRYHNQFGLLDWEVLPAPGVCTPNGATSNPSCNPGLNFNSSSGTGAANFLLATAGILEGSFRFMLGKPSPARLKITNVASDTVLVDTMFVSRANTCANWPGESCIDPAELYRVGNLHPSTATTPVDFTTVGGVGVGTVKVDEYSGEFCTNGTTPFSAQVYEFEVPFTIPALEATDNVRVEIFVPQCSLDAGSSQWEVAVATADA